MPHCKYNRSTNKRIITNCTFVPRFIASHRYFEESSKEKKDEEEEETYEEFNDA